MEQRRTDENLEAVDVDRNGDGDRGDRGDRPRRGGDRRGPPKSRDGALRPLEVVVVEGDVERAIRALKREVGKEGILKALKRKRYYEKPSEARKRKQREAVRRRRRAERRVRK